MSSGVTPNRYTGTRNESKGEEEARRVWSARLREDRPACDCVCGVCLVCAPAPSRRLPRPQALLLPHPQTLRLPHPHLRLPHPQTLLLPHPQTLLLPHHRLAALAWVPTGGGFAGLVSARLHLFLDFKLPPTPVSTLSAMAPFNWSILIYRLPILWASFVQTPRTEFFFFGRQL
jgi:hypothetical protein